MVERVSDAVFTVSCDLVVKSWNLAAERIFGIPSDLVVGRGVDAAFAASEAQSIKWLFNRIEQLAELEDADLRAMSGSHQVRVPDYPVIDVEWRAFALVDDAGEVAGFTCVLEDVTKSRRAAARRAALNRLRTAALRARRASEVLDLAATTVAAAADVDFVSILELVPEHDQLVLVAESGWPTARIGDARVCLIEDGADQTVMALAVDEPLVSLDVFHDDRFEPAQELRAARGPVGSGITIAIRAGGEPWGVLAGHRSERREFTNSEIAVFRTVADIIGTVSERQRSDRMLLDDDRRRRLDVLGKVAAGLSHDLGNVLGGIENLVVSAREVPGTPAELSTYLDHIQAEAGIGRGVLDQVVRFTTLAPDPETEVDVGVLLAGLVDRLAVSVPSGVRLSYEGPDEGMPVLAGTAPIDQIARNLVRNALDAVDAGGSVTVRLTEEHVNAATTTVHNLGSGRWARIDVVDDGRGIPEEQLDLVFDPFFSTKGSGPTSGLGLTQVKGLVHRCGGRVELANAPGGGTTATVWLPRALHLPAD